MHNDFLIDYLYFCSLQVFIIVFVKILHLLVYLLVLPSPSLLPKSTGNGTLLYIK